MNERIKELIEKATTVDVTIDEFGGTSYTPVFDKEKFAELLVKECVYTIKLGMTRDGHDTKHYKQSLKHIDMIKEHFGVN